MSQKLHILVVDDCPTDRELLRKRLHDLDVDCTTCENGHGAVATFKRIDFDGVILDGHAPTYMDMAESAQVKGSSAPMIFYSGDDDMPNLKQMWDNGYFVLTKNHVTKEALPNSLGAFIRLINMRKHTRG